MSGFEVGQEVYYGGRYGDHARCEIAIVKSVGKTKITLDDGTEWNKNGNRWGSGRDPFASDRLFVLDAEARKRIVGARRAQDARYALKVLHDVVMRLTDPDLLERAVAALRGVVEGGKDG